MTRPTSMKKMTLTRTANTSSWLRKSNCVEASRKKRKAKGRPRGALAKSRGLRLLPSPPCANRAAALANTLSARWWPSHFGLLSPSISISLELQLPRIPIPRTPVNKEERRGPSAGDPASFLASPALSAEHCQVEGFVSRSPAAIRGYDNHLVGGCSVGR